jgi:threonylcarbamoyladenosine tRNA methylthiotransferase MtaB
VPTYRIVTLGCKLNQADSAGLEARLRALGLERAGGATEGRGEAPADLVILNTCTVTHNADREARQIARRLRRQNPGATLVATGCYAQRDPRELRAVPGIDHVVGLREQEGRIPAIAAAAFGLRPDPEPRVLGLLGATEGCDPRVESSDRTRAYLKIQDGCDLRCSYCVIPSVRGPSRSLDPETVLRRISDLVASGFREIVFTGVNTGDYGKDLEPPLRLGSLLERAIGIDGLGRVRLNSLEPKTVTGDLIALLASSPDRLARHLQIPLQSGCDGVLARMRRNYRTSDYARVVETLRRAVPSIGLGADVIVGFPGETETEFDTTVRFIASSPLNYLHVFAYSPRPGTTAAALTGQVPPEAIRERSARLRALGRDLSLRFRRSFVGRDLPVLALREIRRDGRLRGLSDNFIDLGIDLAERDPAPLMNRILPVRITLATEDTTLAEVA